MLHIKATSWNYFKYQIIMKVLYCNICSNNNDKSIGVVISVLVLFIADILIIGISVNLFISVPLKDNQFYNTYYN